MHRLHVMDLPLEIVSLIATDLDTRSYLRLSGTCRTLAHCLQHTESVWRRFLERDFPSAEHTNNPENRYKNLYRPQYLDLIDVSSESKPVTIIGAKKFVRGQNLTFLNHDGSVWEHHPDWFLSSDPRGFPPNLRSAVKLPMENPVDDIMMDPLSGQVVALSRGGAVFAWTEGRLEGRRVLSNISNIDIRDGYLVAVTKLTPQQVDIYHLAGTSALTLVATVDAEDQISAIRAQPKAGAAALTRRGNLVVIRPGAPSPNNGLSAVHRLGNVGKRKAVVGIGDGFIGIHVSHDIIFTHNTRELAVFHDSNQLYLGLFAGSGISAPVRNMHVVSTLVDTITYVVINDADGGLWQGKAIKDEAGGVVRLTLQWTRFVVDGKDPFVLCSDRFVNHSFGVLYGICHTPEEAPSSQPIINR